MMRKKWGKIHGSSGEKNGNTIHLYHNKWDGILYEHLSESYVFF
jgi:hypothetical protein